MLWGVLYLIIVYVFYARSSSFVENAFSVAGGAFMLMCLFYLCKLFAGVDVEAAARRVFLTGVFSVVFTVTFSFANLALLCLGRSYFGEIPTMFQLSSLGVALFQLTFLVTFRRYSLRRTPRADTGEMDAVRPEETDGAAARPRKPKQRGGRRFRPD